MDLSKHNHYYKCGYIFLVDRYFFFSCFFIIFAWFIFFWLFFNSTLRGCGEFFFAFICLKKWTILWINKFSVDIRIHHQLGALFRLSFRICFFAPKIKNHNIHIPTQGWNGCTRQTTGDLC